MMMKSLDSLQNPKVKTWLKYHHKKYRDRDQRFLIEGQHLVEEALKAKAVDVILIRDASICELSFPTMYSCSNEIMSALSTNVSKVDIIAVCVQQHLPIAHFHRIMMLDDVQDPGNVGTIIRSAHSFGFDAIVLSEGCVDLYSDKVIRSTQGALFYLPIVRKPLLDMMTLFQQEGCKIIATSLQKDSFSLKDTKAFDRMVFVVGNEGQGVSADIIKQSDQTLRIEMKHFDSLNVGVAASICMYTFQI